MGKWQLRTWTKGTGAAVEPVGAADRPPAPARPGRPRALPPRGPWTPPTERIEPASGAHRTAAEARRRHARRFVSDAAIARLEELEADLLSR
ncbi:MAG TPA: hypothetical protein VH459_10730 [Gaiellales bacterium]